MSDPDISVTHIIASLVWECAVARFLAVESSLGLALSLFPQSCTATHCLQNILEPYLARKMVQIEVGKDLMSLRLLWL